MVEKWEKLIRAEQNKRERRRQQLRSDIEAQNEREARMLTIATWTFSIAFFLMTIAAVIWLVIR